MSERLRTSAGFARFFPHNLLDERKQGRNIFLGGFPQDLIVDSKVLVDQFVAHPGHLLLWNVRMSFTYGRRELFRRFTDNLEGPHHGINSLLILCELGPGHASDEFGDVLCSLLNIIEVVEKFACARHRPTTSLRI